jgi:hypothetical protein
MRKGAFKITVGVKGEKREKADLDFRRLTVRTTCPILENHSRNTHKYRT